MNIIIMLSVTILLIELIKKIVVGGISYELHLITVTIYNYTLLKYT